VIIPTLKRIL